MLIQIVQMETLALLSDRFSLELQNFVLLICTTDIGVTIFLVIFGLGFNQAVPKNSDLICNTDIAYPKQRKVKIA